MSSQDRSEPTQTVERSAASSHGFEGMMRDLREEFKTQCQLESDVHNLQARHTIDNAMLRQHEQLINDQAEQIRLGIPHHA